jgi:hypothetical protein
MDVIKALPYMEREGLHILGLAYKGLKKKAIQQGG